jgi:transposase-like protein
VAAFETGAAQLKPIYTASTESAALDAFAEFSAKWETKYPAIVRLWTNAWAEMVPFLGFDVETAASCVARMKSSMLEAISPPNNRR